MLDPSPPPREPGEDLALTLKKLREAKQCNRVAGIVANAYGEMTDDAADRHGVDDVPVIIVREMLAGVINALAGETDLAKLNLSFGGIPQLPETLCEISQVAAIRIRAVLNADAEV